MKVFIIAKSDNEFKIIKYIENNAVLYMVPKGDIRIVKEPANCDALVFDEDNITTAREVITLNSLCKRAIFGFMERQYPCLTLNY